MSWAGGVQASSGHASSWLAVQLHLHAMSVLCQDVRALRAGQVPQADVSCTPPTCTLAGGCHPTGRGHSHTAHGCRVVGEPPAQVADEA